MAESRFEHDILAQILCRIPADGLVRTQSGRYRRLGRDAGVLDSLCSLRAVGQDEFELEIHSAFLENFLVDAEAFWARRGEGLWRSGTWIEGQAEAEHPYEAIAVSLPTADALIVQGLDDSYQSLQSVIQRAREISLERQSLAREIVLREELAACLLHDLRAPLSSIVGALSLLRDTPSSSEEHALLVDRALEQSTRQSAMIARLLDEFGSELDELQSFHESGPQAPDLARVAARAADAMVPAFEQHQVRLEVDLPEGAETAVVGRSDPLERIFSNLLENALRVAPRGSTVRVTVHPANPDGPSAEHAGQSGQLLATVEDQGPGVPTDEVAFLFDRLRTGRHPLRRGVRGLGLYFCRSTAERWGGQIDYEPRETGGARFSLRLPRARQAQA